MNVLGICLNLKSHVSHMLYNWDFSYYNSVSIISMRDKYYFSDDNNTKVFAWAINRNSEVLFTNMSSYTDNVIFI